MSLTVGEIVKGKVTGITNFGAFVETEDGSRGMIHISEISRSYIEDIKSVLKVGQAVTVKVITVSGDGKIALSMKQLEQAPDQKKPGQRKPRPEKTPKPRKKFEPAPAVTSPGEYHWESAGNSGSFEDMMSKFKRTSEDKMSDLKRGESRGYSRRGNGSGRK